MHQRVTYKLIILSLMLIAAGCKKDISSGFSYEKFYLVKPDIQNCIAGTVSNTSKQAALSRLNYIRSLHQLPPVDYKNADDELVQQSALISAANATLDHHPNETFECYTPAGAVGSSQSNLSINLKSGPATISDEENIDSWLTEEFSESLGHRRWLLDPFLKYVAYGRVDGKPKKSNYAFVSTASLKVVNDEEADATVVFADYVAYPYQDYPAKLFPKNMFLSFSALYDRRTSVNNIYVKFDYAVVEVSDDAGQSLQVTNVSFDNNAAGLPNVIQWKVNGLKDNVQYHVKIKNVYRDGSPFTYQYKFKVVD